MRSPVAELEQRITPREFAEWVAMDRISPICPEWRADLRMGIQTAALVNIQLSRKARLTKPADFMPQFGKETKRQSNAEIGAKLRLLAQMQKRGK